MGKSPRKSAKSIKSHKSSKSNKSHKSHNSSSSKSIKNYKNYAKKKIGKSISSKYITKNLNNDDSDSSLTNLSEDESDDGDEHDEHESNFYSAPVFSDTSDDSDKNIFNDSSDESSDVSSSDDDDVDFVKLTNQRKIEMKEKAKAAKSIKSTKSTKSTKRKFSNKITDTISNTISNNLSEINNELPDINFTFEFEEPIQSDEDIGEEIISYNENINTNTDFNNIDDTITVPKIHSDDESINFQENDSDNESINENDLIATLQNDNDFTQLQSESEDYDDDLLREEEDALLYDLKYEYGKYNNSDDFFMSNGSGSVAASSTANVPANATTTAILDNINENHSDLLQYISDNNSNYDFEDESDFQIPFEESPVVESDSESDSYLWNYFLSDGNDSNGSQSDGNANMDSDTGDSTDEDLSLPKSQIGSNAQEILSSSNLTARPPMLGTWTTHKYKPFSIIDGLSTNSILNEAPPAPVVLGMVHDEPMGIDELLNISELEDDFFDDSLWDKIEEKSYNLSAFRNKGLVNHENEFLNIKKNYGVRRKSKSKKKSKKNKNKNPMNNPAIMKAPKEKIDKLGMTKNPKDIKDYIKLRRKNSIEESTREGLVLTKSGLFNEIDLANVEQVLADIDNNDDLLNLFKGLN